ncbi:MAG: YlxM family DNA-binding protein [Lactobacillaceae bacterium]
MKFADKIRITRLIDVYGGLLTQKQLDYLVFYYDEDLSLNEIGEYFKISRQAVSENLRRSVQQLENYETKVGLLSRLDQLDNLLNKIGNMNSSTRKLVKEIRKIMDFERGN